MITEDKVTKLFCIADDFCKFFDAMMEKYTLKADKKRQYHRKSTMLKAEIMVIMILFHDSGYRCLKHFYIERYADICVTSSRKLSHTTDGAARAEAKLVWIMPKYRANESRVKLAWLCRVQPIFNEVNRDRGRR